MTETEFKKLLWDSANKLRGAMSAAEYKFPVLGLVFDADNVHAVAAELRRLAGEPADESRSKS